MAEKKQNGLQVFNRAITSPGTQKYLQDVLGERKGSFVNNLTALVANNVSLQSCEPYTVMFAAMKATALNLPLDNSLGMAYVLPYADNKRGITVAQFQLGYKAYKQLALRTGQFKVINATDVREGEIAKRNRLTGEIDFAFVDDEEKRKELPVIGYVSYFRLHNGYESTFYMSKEEVEAHALRYSQTYKSNKAYIKEKSPWTTDFDVMAKKTVVKLNLSKNAPLSVEFNELRDAINADQSVMFKSYSEYEYVDNDGKGYDEDEARKAEEKFADFETFSEASQDEK